MRQMGNFEIEMCLVGSKIALWPFRDWVAQKIVKGWHGRSRQKVESWTGRDGGVN